MKKYLHLAVKILISAILIYFIMKKVDLTKLNAPLKQGSIGNLFSGVIIGIIFNLVKFFKWHWLIQTMNINKTYWDSAKSYMIGNALGIITPMRAGDLGRSLYYNPKDRPGIMGFTIIDRLLDLIAVVFFCIAGGFILFNMNFGIILGLL